VTLTPVGGAPEVVAVQVSVAGENAAPMPQAPQTPAIEVSSKRVDFGMVDRAALNTARVSVTVTNVGRSTAQVEVQGAPRWLLVKPDSFRLEPGKKQVVKLVGRIDKVRDRRQKVSLVFAPRGGRNQEVQVLLQLKRRRLFG
jgi:hypothetical protein